MKIGMLGTGLVGQTLGNKLVALGHHVAMGSRSAANEAATRWAVAGGERASHGTFADAAAFGEVVFNATAGMASLAVLCAAGAEHLRGKLVVDVSNPLDFSQGTPATLSICNTDSVGEQLQHAFPEALVVKTLNTVSCEIMVDPAKIPGLHNVFVSGNDACAKDQTCEILRALGWPAAAIIDLGNIDTARGPEMYLPLWLRLWGALGTGRINIAVLK